MKFSKKIELILYYKQGVNINNTLDFTKKIITKINGSSNCLFYFQKIFSDSDIKNILPNLYNFTTQTTLDNKKMKKYIFICLNELHKKVVYYP